MNDKSTPNQTFAYTTSRPDIFEMVPNDSLTILDVGCSNGALGYSLAVARPGRKVYGLEYNQAFADEASSKLEHVECVDLNTFDWDSFMPGLKFDCIIFADVLEHLLFPKEQLISAKKRLKRDGSIVISLPNIRHLSAFLSIFIKGTFPTRDRGIFDRTHLHWFTIFDAKALLIESGYKLEKLSFTMRVGDKGGGLANKIAFRLLGRFQRMFFVREFLTYQFCCKARAVDS